MKPLLIKRKIVKWLLYFVSSRGKIHKFTFSNKQTAECLMRMFLSVRKCAWVERKEKQIWFNVASFD